MEPVVSVIVPAYNAQGTLDRCISNIQQQTMPDIEIFLVDDGSTDTTPAICDAYALQDSRIKVIHKQNGGVSTARNAGLAQATGTWLAFVDADDYVDADMCALLVDAAQASGAEMVLCGYIKHQGRKQVAGSQESFDLPQWRSNADCFWQLYANSRINSPWAKLFLRSRVSSGFVENLALGEDLLFVLAYLKTIDHVTVLSNPSYHLVETPGSLTRVYRPDLFENSLMLHAQVRDFAQEQFHACDEQTLNATLANMFRRNAGRLAKATEVSHRQKRDTLNEWLQEPELQRALLSANGSGMTAVFNNLAKAKRTQLLLLALKFYHRMADKL